MKKTFLKQILNIILIGVLFISSLPIYATEPTTQSIPDIQAQSAILINAKTGEVLYEKNSHEKHYPASITKIMTALLAIENLKPTDVISFSKEAIYGIEPGSSNAGMRAGEQITVDQALHALMLVSANEVANGLAEKVSGSIENFAATMNNRAAELGAKNTHFVNPHGLDDPNHYTTAYDMALIMRGIYSNEYFIEIMKNATYQIPPTNKANEVRPLAQQHSLLSPYRDSRLYRKDVIGGKTGYTDIARHTLVTSARQGDIDLIVVVMKAEKASMYQDTSKLLDYGFNNFQSFELVKKDEVIKSLPMFSIKSGKLVEVAQCEISSVAAQSVLISKSIKMRDILTKVTLPEYLEPNQKQDDLIGSIEYLYDNKVLARSDLKISKIHFAASPYKADQPTQSELTFPVIPLLILLGIIGILIFLIYLLIKRKRNKRFKHKKLKFSKTLK